ncbi:UDP-N-acetylglucosamine 2-epimerase [Miltoncostaea marina]|uniref:UDP-N-acetylglucosamine 2-epimerase n=1 Tax=Miltoncostaea marina TaxID=2843215 RepID=UPI001C3C3B76|nr:UDP-N-acetylglucosamine 2-epimerase [Miltoncostaea marina]
MIAAIYGTTGELIKLAPLLRRLAEAGCPAFTVCTAQQPEQIPSMLEDLGVPPPDLWIDRTPGAGDLERAGQIPGWLAGVARGVIRHRRSLRAAVRGDGRPPLVLVHGDTFTTVIGAVIGRLLGARVGHVEAGLRSGDWRNPFPEELDRRITSRLAQLHFAPGSWAAGNLRRARVGGTIVDTGGNTIRDALALVDDDAPMPAGVPPGRFGLVSIHRFELLRSRSALAAVLEVLREEAQRLPLVFIDHPVTVQALRSQGLDHLVAAPGIHRVPRQRYVPFISLLKRSEYLVTDSGGCQEECAELGHPCLVHRAATERQDGLDGPVVLSGLDVGVLRGFLAERPSGAPAGATVSPTAVILEYLVSAGHAPADGLAHGERALR